MGPDSYTNYNNLLSCAESGGASDATIILDPSPGYAVDGTPLLTSSGTCDSNVDYSRSTPSSKGDSVHSSDLTGTSPMQPQQSPPSRAATTLATSVLVVAEKPSSSAKGGKVGSIGDASVESCDWEGHCKGASCQTYNDCGDPLSCVNGACA